MDVAIIGASSAGLFAAGQLARAGLQVGVFEQTSTLPQARRTLIITPELEKILGPLPDEVVLHRIDCLEIETATKRKLSIRLREPDLIVERTALIRHLASDACKAGATIHLDHRFRTIEPSRSGAKLFFQGKGGEPVAVQATAVIGADGVHSDLCKVVGATPADSAPILQAEIKLPQRWDPSVTRVWIDTADTRYFYWLIPESHERAVVGLVGDGREPLRSTLERCLHHNGWEPIAFQGARIAMHRPGQTPWAKVGSAPVLFIGDAAGQVKVTTVGGTVTGLLGAAAAARALIHGTSYEFELKGVQKELNLHYYIRRVLDRLDNRGYELLANAVHPRLRAYLSEHNRDEYASTGLILNLLQPAFLRFGLYLLFTPGRDARVKSRAQPSQPDSAL